MKLIQWWINGKYCGYRWVTDNFVKVMNSKRFQKRFDVEFVIVK